MDAAEAIDLDRYPIDRPESTETTCPHRKCEGRTGARRHVQSGRLSQARRRPPSAIAEGEADARSGFLQHTREHNIYFKPSDRRLAGRPSGARKVKTTNHTICTDQLAGSLVRRSMSTRPGGFSRRQSWRSLTLHIMADPLAGANVMAYRDGEALNWHFDRSEFTTTLLLQKPEAGGEFEYRTDLRSDSDPNYDGVARLLLGADPDGAHPRIVARNAQRVSRPQYGASRHDHARSACAHHCGLLLFREDRALLSRPKSALASTAGPAERADSTGNGNDRNVRPAGSVTTSGAWVRQ